MKIFDKESHEYADLFPMIEREDLERLKEDIKTHGQLQPVIMLNNKILDGRNRYTACMELGITPKLEEYTGDKPFEYVISTNLKRRHLNESQKAVLSLSVEKEIAKINKQKQIEAAIRGNINRNIESSVVAQIPQPSIINKKDEEKKSSTQASKIMQVSPRYIRDAKKIAKENPEQIELILNGKKTITEVKKEIRVEAIKQQRIEIAENVKKITIKDKYDVIVIDPPWQYAGDNGTSENYDPDGFRSTCPYPTMSKEEIQNIKLPCANNCVLWLWTTNLFLKDSFELLDKWGFQLKSILTWDKEHIATGRWLRSQTEHCILAIKGKPFYNNTKWSTLIREKRTEHSKKPEIFYKMVDETCAGLKLDYFARTNREGWDVYGDEIKNG